MKYFSLLIALVFVIFCGCTTATNQPDKSQSYISENWQWDTRFPAYNSYAKQAIIKYGSSLYGNPPKDVIDFCPDYFSLSADSRLMFWVNFLSALSYEESDHDSDLEYQERFEDNYGNKVISKGLFQLSYESSQNYDCNISNHDDLKNPQVNIECATKILNKWNMSDNRITGRRFKFFGSWKGGARYWSVLRKKNTKMNIINNLRTASYLPQKQRLQERLERLGRATLTN